MRFIVFILSFPLPLSAGAEVLAPSPPPPPVNQEGMKDFCIYGNQIYSLGAEVCVPNSNGGLRCVSSEGSKSGGRAFWSFDNKEWPTALNWRCGPGGEGVAR
jgi:hypothetical protein